MSDKKFYVYVHKYASGPKEGQVFYVGKGSRFRYSKVHGRNKHWINIVNKYGFTHEIVMKFSYEECSFSVESALISFYGIENLCNYSTGGEGPSGFKKSEETVKKMTFYQNNRGENHNKNISISKLGSKHHFFISKIYDFENVETGEIFSGTRVDFNNYSGLPRSAIKKLCDGENTKSGNWKIQGRKSILDKIKFKNIKSGEIIYCSQRDMTKLHGYDCSSVSKLILGKSKTMKGWKIA